VSARIGEVLVAAGACNTEQVRDALDGQIIYGARVGTNLLETGAVSEEALGQALAQQHGCPALWGEVVIESQVLDLVRQDVADRLEVVPLRLEGRRLSVLVADPRNLRKLDELSFAVGKEVRPVVAAESRVWELLRRHYGVPRPARGVEAAWSRARPALAAAVAPPAAAEPDLMDEAEFAALYDRTGAAPAGAPAAAAEPEDAFRGRLVTTDEVLAALQQEAEQDADRLAPIPIRITPTSLEPPPLSFDEAVVELAGVQDREAIGRVVLRCARSRFRRAVLLMVRGHVASGWQGLGEGLTPQAVANVRLALDQPGVVQMVVASRAHFLGPLQKTPANVQFLRALGGGAPRNSFAMPILARGQVVNVLYADNGRGQLVDGAAVGDLLIMATKIAQSYDVLLARAR
jgi:hypothetical protein